MKRYTKFQIKGRTLFNPTGVDICAVIECDRPCTISELSGLLGNYGALDPIKEPITLEYWLDDEAIESVATLQGIPPIGQEVEICDVSYFVQNVTKDSDCHDVWMVDIQEGDRCEQVE